MNVKMTLNDFSELVGFWGGAIRVWENLTDAERDYLEDLVEDCGFTFDSLTAVNDFMWFDVPELLEEEEEEEEEWID